MITTENLTVRFGTEPLFENVNIKFGLYHTSSNVQYPFVKENYGVINNCKAAGSIYTDCFKVNEQYYKCGIFAGENRENAIIKNCNNEVSITINSDISFVAAGGIAGANEGLISNCNNKGYILADLTDYDANYDSVRVKVVSVAGGIAGLNCEKGVIEDCVSDRIGNARCEIEAIKVYIISDFIAVDSEKIIDNNHDDEDDNKPGNNDDEIVKGDADLNNKIDLSDAKLALKYALGIENAQGENLKSADLNGDNKVTLDEVKVILKYALGIIKEIKM